MDTKTTFGSLVAEQILQGAEVVIISDNKNSNSAVFWYNREEKAFYAFSRSFGVMKRTDYSISRFIGHINDMYAENAQIIIRGRDF